GLAASERQGRRLRRTAGRGRSRQPYLEAASLRRLALHTDGSIMIADDFANGGQAQAGARKASGEKRLEHASGDVLAESNPTVAEGEADVAARRQLAIAHGKSIGPLLLLHGDMNLAAARHRLRRIGAQIEDDLLQLRGLPRYGHLVCNLSHHELDPGR